jgi:hypothetical protein
VALAGGLPVHTHGRTTALRAYSSEEGRGIVTRMRSGDLV